MVNGVVIASRKDDSLFLPILKEFAVYNFITSRRFTIKEIQLLISILESHAKQQAAVNIEDSSCKIE